MQLYLVQHGKAVTKQENPERPLSDKGRIDSERAAEFLAGLSGFTVSRIVHSGKLRAKQTADIFGRAVGPEDGVMEADGLAPQDEPMIWESILEDIHDDIMLVGHLPHLGKLASALTAGDENTAVVSFFNAGIVCLSRESGSRFSIQWAVIPKLLR